MTALVQEREDAPPSPLPLATCLWIDWGRHVRTHSMVRALGMELAEIVVAASPPRRYLSCARRTLALLRARRPRVVVATNPSLLLGLWLLFLRPWLRYRLVSDAHYVGVQALRGGRLVQWLLDLHNRAVDLVIVTNPGHAERLTALGARSFICPDPLPELDERTATRPELPPRSVFLICSFDADEPFEAVFAAFEQLSQEGFRLAVSGNPAKGGVDPARHPWVRFLGFVPMADYLGHLRACDVAIDLTELENCLVCGAYEALRLGRPLVLSNSAALRGHFAPACVFTANDPTSIAEAVRAAYREREQLQERSRTWTRENEITMRQRLAALAERLAALAEG